MEVHITSKQMIKPSSSEVHLLKPFKLSLLDQFSLTFYIPFVFFYNKPFDSQFSDRLKQSLSKALTQFYPLAGRTKNNLFISDYDEGVPYIETMVKDRLSDFIEWTRDELEAMNPLLPCRPFCNIRDYSTVPQLAIQVNTFECGGIAIALCCFHKIIDATTISAFLKSWTAFSRGPYDEIPNIRHDLLEAGSRLFPPIESMMPVANIDVKHNEDHKCKTRSFVFDANAIASLKLKAKSKSLEHPPRVVALGAFLWKHAIKACTSVSGSPKESALCLLVNIRQKMKPQLPDNSIGNLFFMPTTTYNPVKKDIELTELACKVSEASKRVTSDAGLESVTGQLSENAAIVSKGNTEIYVLNSWVNILDGNEDFGWGMPISFSIPGVDSHNRECGNSFFLKKARQHNAIEAWVTLSDKAMCVLELDPEFLAFVSTPYFDKSKI